MIFLLGYNLNIAIQLGKLTFGGGREKMDGGGGGESTGGRFHRF